MRIWFRMLFITVILGSFAIGKSFAFDRSECEEKTFTLTAYYSPKENQKFYYKENLEAERTLNGDGFVGASGKKVFNGMLAAPSSYEFGTVIYFPDLGVGEVADRGGAIVHAGERGQSNDRIDVWMGEGEEGLIRALTFGKETMKGYLCTPSKVKDQNIDIKINFDYVPMFKNFFDSAIWLQQMWPGRTDIRSATLQKYLIKLGYLPANKNTGFYGPETTAALCKYQVKKGIIGSSHPDCGVFGARTRYVMKEDVKARKLLPSNMREHGTLSDIMGVAVAWQTPNTSEIDIKPNVVSNNSDVRFEFYRPYHKGEENSEISLLQKFLIEQECYKGEVTGVFDQNTIDAVFQFQLENSLVSEEDSYTLHGYLGPSTRKKINSYTNS